MEVKMEVKNGSNKWTIPYRQTASKAIVLPTRWLYFKRDSALLPF